MLTRENCHLVSKGIIKSIQEFLPSERKLLLLDVLYFLSIKTEFQQVCMKSDIEAINKLFDFCKESNIDPYIYVSCAYPYIGKYNTPGRKLPLGYLLSEKVVSYVSSRIKTSVDSEALISTQIRMDLIYTEKQIREYSKNMNVSYNEAFNMFCKLGRVSDTFLMYKVYLGQEPVYSMKLSEKMQALYDSLEPLFIGLASKHGHHSAVRAKKWSNSKIESYSFCPVYFRDHYLNDDIPPKYLKNEASETGSAVHKVFEDIVNRYKKAKNKDINAIYNRYMSGKPFEKVKESISEHLKGIQDFFTDPNSPFLTNLKPDSILMTEEEFRLELKDNDVLLTGIVDLIIINGDEAVVLDYKTSKIDSPIWLEKNNEKYHKQLSLYAEFIEKQLNVKVTKIVIVYTRGLIKEYDNVNRNILQERLEDIAKIRMAIKLNNFPANSKSCGLCRHPNCPFRSAESMWDDNGNRKIKAK